MISCSFQTRLATDALAYTNPRGQPRLLLIGDSITEALRGTAIGQAVPRTIGHEQALAVLVDFPRPLILAISSDETQHVLWRLRAGAELTPAISSDAALVISLLIGTNNVRRSRLEPCGIPTAC